MWSQENTDFSSYDLDSIILTVNGQLIIHAMDITQDEITSKGMMTLQLVIHGFPNRFKSSTFQYNHATLWCSSEAFTRLMKHRKTFGTTLGHNLSYTVISKTTLAWHELAHLFQEK